MAARQHDWITGRHPSFWFEDGSLLIRIENVAFRLHKTLLHRHSHLLNVWTLTIPENSDLGDVVFIPDQIKAGLVVEDFEALLEHLYHDVPMSGNVEFTRLVSILRVSSPKQLDFPAIYALARKYIENMFPSGPQPFFHTNLEEALAVATKYRIDSIRKGLFYSIVTTSDFDTEDDDASAAAMAAPLPSDPYLNVSQTLFPCSHPGQTNALTTADSKRCRSLMTNIIDHFTPIVFTPPTTPHMACTDVLAETWMTLVIQPALENDGVYKPLETLERMKSVDWAKKGLCQSCVREKREEWTMEQEDIWNRIDGWLELGDENTKK